MTFQEELLEKARTCPRRILFPEAEDERIVEAAARLVDLGVAIPVMPDLATIPAERLEVYVERLAMRRKKMTAGMARRLLDRPLYLAAAMLAAGDGDVLVAGAANPTRRVIEAGMMTVGLAEGIEIPSSYFLLLPPASSPRAGKPLVLADCAVNIEPDAHALAAIALASAATAARLLDDPPRVAFLSFSTHGSAAHASIEKITDALERVRESAPGLMVDGELQGDTALSQTIAERKIRRPSDVAGRANVLIFPDLASGNIAYKLLQEIGGARAIGPFLQGFARPICDLSRGATVEDIVMAAIISGLQV
ncbi:MAG: phosphate acyltransferase [Geminicoccaceae bacterium]